MRVPTMVSLIAWGVLAQMRVLKLGRICASISGRDAGILLCALCEPMDRYLNCWGPSLKRRFLDGTPSSAFIGTPVHGFLVLSRFCR